MSVEFVEKRSPESTRQRILDAAIVRFAQASYEEVKLRDVAAEVGVDVALVHRTFGSKEQLFAESFAAAVQPERILISETKGLSGIFANYLFEPGAGRVANSDRGGSERRLAAIKIFVRSLSSPQAREVLRTHIVSDFIVPLAANLWPPSLQRAALIISCFAGISVLRDVLQIDALLDGSRDESQPLIERIFRACLDEDAGAGAATTMPLSKEPKKRKPRGRVSSGIAGRRKTSRLPAGVGD